MFRRRQITLLTSLYFLKNRCKYLLIFHKRPSSMDLVLDSHDPIILCRTCRILWYRFRTSPNVFLIWIIIIIIRGLSIYENIVDISPISIYRYRYRIGTLCRFFDIDIVSVTSEISVIFLYFIILSRLFNVNLKTDNYMSKVEYLI